jgi:E1A/CREB-binding protein
MTQEIIQLLFSAFSVTTKRLLIDHLPGGIHHNVTDENIIQETAGVPTTNVSPERDFAVLDRLLREKPNANLTALEAMIMFAHNKSSVWMERLTSDERAKLLDAARTLAPTLRAKFKARRQEIAARREEDVQRRVEANARKKLKAVREKEKLTKDIEKLGLWINRTEIEDGIDAFVKQAKKKEALKLQIKFRHKVLGQTHPNKDVLKFSHNRRPFSVDQLKNNLLLLIDEDEDLEPSLDTSLNNEDYMQHPAHLVGKRIQHRFKVGRKYKWYNGIVLHMHPSTKEFEVKYDGEDDACCYALLEDIESGDLKIC